MEDCIFCKIIKGEIPSKKVYENEYVYAFEDIHPVAPVHILVIPKIHIPSLNDINEDNSKYVSEIFKSIVEITKLKNICNSGYRVISNCGEDGGQVVNHLHFHVLGGKDLGPKLVK